MPHGMDISVVVVVVTYLETTIFAFAIIVKLENVGGRVDYLNSVQFLKIFLLFCRVCWIFLKEEIH